MFRLMLQTLTDDQLNRGLRARLLTEDEVLEISERGSLELSFIDKLKIGLRLMKVPDVASRLRLALRYMNEIKSLYETYPTDPSNLSSWYRKVMSTYRDYSRGLGLSLKWLSNA